MRKLPHVRYINAASVEIGDTVKVSWKTDDVEHTRVGIVAKRDYEGGMRVFYSPKGIEIFRWHPAHDKEYRVTLLNRVEHPQEMLDFEHA